jgi:hypothetical protein
MPDQHAPDIMAEIRVAWEQRWGASGAQWEEHEPRYHYAMEMKTDPRYGSHPWETVERELQAEWERRHPNTSWEKAKGHVQEAWEHLSRRQKS